MRKKKSHFNIPPINQMALQNDLLSDILNLIEKSMNSISDRSISDNEREKVAEKISISIDLLKEKNKDLGELIENCNDVIQQSNNLINTVNNDMDKMKKSTISDSDLNKKTLSTDLHKEIIDHSTPSLKKLESEQFKLNGILKMFEELEKYPLGSTSSDQDIINHQEKFNQVKNQYVLFCENSSLGANKNLIDILNIIGNSVNQEYEKLRKNNSLIESEEKKISNIKYKNSEIDKFEYLKELSVKLQSFTYDEIASAEGLSQIAEIYHLYKTKLIDFLNNTTLNISQAEKDKIIQSAIESTNLIKKMREFTFDDYATLTEKEKYFIDPSKNKSDK